MLLVHLLLKPSEYQVKKLLQFIQSKVCVYSCAVVAIKVLVLRASPYLYIAIIVESRRIGSGQTRLQAKATAECFRPCVHSQKGSLTINTCSYNLIGLPTFLHKAQKPIESDQTLSFAIAQYSNGKGRGWHVRLIKYICRCSGIHVLVMQWWQGFYILSVVEGWGQINEWPYNLWTPLCHLSLWVCMCLSSRISVPHANVTCILHSQMMWGHNLMHQ